MSSNVVLSSVILPNVPVPMMNVRTVVGMLTNLPCNITPSVPGDRVLIVLWYKDGYGKPLYR